MTRKHTKVDNALGQLRFRQESIQTVALPRGFEAVERRLESLLDKVLAAMNATDLAKEYEIARNELEQAISQYVGETAPNCDEYPAYVVLSKVRELTPEVSARQTVLCTTAETANAFLIFVIVTSRTNSLHFQTKTLRTSSPARLSSLRWKPVR